MTTKELIAKLREVDPEETKEVALWVPGIRFSLDFRIYLPAGSKQLWLEP